MLAVALPLLLLYAAYVRLDRYKRIKRIHADYAARHGLSSSAVPLSRQDDDWPTRAKLPMTPAEAQKIMLPSFWYEMPWTQTKAFAFALFKTYGIPTISDLLAKTGELKDADKAGRRYADTSVLINGFMTFPIDGPGSGRDRKEGERPDPRCAVAVARMNWLHERYRGKISNDDFLYTLSTFILEPRIWTQKYDWRAITPLEEQALFVFFSEIGRRMGIENIPTELRDLYEWAESYEQEHMIPDKSNHDVAAETVELLLFNVPQFARPIARQVVSALVYPRLRKAIILGPPHPLVERVVVAALKVRALFVRHLMLPRSKPYSSLPLGDEAPAHVDSHDQLGGSFKLGVDEAYAPRMHPKFYDNEPWYAEPSQGIWYVLERIGLAVGFFSRKQVPGPDFKPEGFRFEELGPIKLESEGHEAVRKMAEAMLGQKLEGPYAVDGMGCPFAFRGSK